MYTKIFNCNHLIIQKQQLICSYRPQKLEMKPMSLKNLSMHDDSECTEKLKLTPFELPPSAISQIGSSSGRSMSQDDIYDEVSSQVSGEGSSQSMFSSTYKSISRTNSSQFSNQGIDEEQEGDDFQLPPAAIAITGEEFLRPRYSIFKRNDSQEAYMSQDLHQEGEHHDIHPESILNFLKSELANDIDLVG